MKFLSGPSFPDSVVSCEEQGLGGEGLGEGLGLGGGDGGDVAVVGGIALGGADGAGGFRGARGFLDAAGAGRGALGGVGGGHVGVLFVEGADEALGGGGVGGAVDQGVGARHQVDARVLEGAGGEVGAAVDMQEAPGRVDGGWVVVVAGFRVGQGPAEEAVDVGGDLVEAVGRRRV